ncbi:MAG: hypothetical protein JW966_15655 [Anaerolineae bacterium]|nr:hypothetical protein [Anaerolineae bacterium]
MYNDHTPIPLTHPLPTVQPAAASFVTNRGMQAIIRRARLEYLATQLLTLSRALRLPVPIEDILYSPPLDLWHINPDQPPPCLMQTHDPLIKRLEMARTVARLVGESGWEPRQRLLGSQSFSRNESDIFCMALLIPTALLAGLNEQQRLPGRVSCLFQVPDEQAAIRLVELGYVARTQVNTLTECFTR